MQAAFGPAVRLSQVPTSVGYESQPPHSPRAGQHAAPVVQRMYEDAEIDIESILDELRTGTDNSKDALAISQLPALDAVTLSQMDDVLRWVMRVPEVKLGLKKGLEKSHSEFASALLGLIANPPQEKVALHQPEIEEAESPRFEAVIRKAVAIHAPRLGSRIDQAQMRARQSGKQLLVIVGEQHDDPYGRVMVTILVGALQRLAANRLYIEATPNAVREHIEPYRHKEPEDAGTEDIAFRQHFYRSLYEQGATVEGVDVEKESVKERVAESLGPMPELEPQRSEWKARFMEKTVAARNVGIARAITTKPTSGVLLVGLTHLPGLAADPSILAAYEIVTVSAVLPEAGEARDLLAYGRVLSPTGALSKMADLYQGGTPETPKRDDAKSAFALAKAMVIELNTA